MAKLATSSNNTTKKEGSKNERNWDLLSTKTTDANGQITWTELVYGTYRLVETDPGQGNSLLADPIVVELPQAAPSDGDTPTYDVTVTAQNSQLLELPAAGGPGLAPYLLAGCGALAAAWWLLGRRPRRG